MRIQITVQPRAAFPPGVGAASSPTNIYPNISYVTVPGFISGELKVQPIVGGDQEGDVMHEATHVYFDLQSIQIGATDEEAICYVVGALYCRMIPGGYSRPAS